LMQMLSYGLTALAGLLHQRLLQRRA
jgi:hypothetical protein